MFVLCHCPCKCSIYSGIDVLRLTLLTEPSISDFQKATLILHMYTKAVDKLITDQMQRTCHLLAVHHLETHHDRVAQVIH